MDLATIAVDRNQARRAFLEYRASARALIDKEADAEYDVLRQERIRRQREQDEAIMRGYRLVALGRQIIDLRATIAAGGVDDLGRPRLAVARADLPRVRMQRWRDGSVQYAGVDDQGWRRPIRGNQRNPRTFGTLDLPTGTLPALAGGSPLPSWADAITPLIPPRFRPAQLDRYHVLWEAEWTHRAPVDPALLRALGGGLYALVAVWDLTALERAVLEIRTTR